MARAVAFASLVIVVLLTIALGWLNTVSNSSWTGVGSSLLISLPFLVVGVVVVLRQPRNPVGWILMGVILLFQLSSTAGLYGQLVYQHGHRGWPGGPVSLFLEPLWAPAIVTLPPAAILLFPDGRVESRVLRSMLRVYVAVSVVLLAAFWALVAGAVIDNNIHLVPDGDLTVVNTPPEWFHLVEAVSLAYVGVCAIVWIGAQVIRWRRATGVYRQQVKWLMGGAAIAVLCLGLLLLGPNMSSSTVGRAVRAALPAGIAALPAGIGVGILRYRLYEIDVIIRKTLVYTALLGLLAGCYLGGVYLMGHLLQALTGQSGALAVTLSTLAVAAAFQPLRARIQRTVDHRFYRRKYDAAQTLDAFTGRLRDQIELEALASDMLDVVRLTLQPSQASIWLVPQRTAVSPANPGGPAP
jgi:hypothetical protein